MSDDPPEFLQGAVPLHDAIGALRGELLRAWWDGRHHELRFEPAAVELTLQVAVTAAGKLGAGVSWWVVNAGGEQSREAAVTQTIKLTLQPRLFDSAGDPLPQLIDATDDSASGDDPTDTYLDAPG